MSVVKAPRSLGILGIGLGEMLTMNFSLVSTSLPTIQKELGAGLLELQWILNIFGVFLCSTLVMAGRLADTYGRKRIFLLGLIGSVLASLMAGCAQNASWIIVAQAIQGIAGASILAVSQALMVHLFPENQKGHAIAIWGAIIGIASAMGPLLSGILITIVGWRWIFFIMTIVAIVAIIVVSFVVKESKSVRHRGEMDYIGMLLLALSLGSLVLGIMQGPRWGWTSIRSILTFVCFAVLAPLFIIVERKVSFPIVHAEFFLKRDFLLPSLANFCFIGFSWTSFFLFPLYFQKIQGESPLATGAIMLLASVPVSIFSYIIGKWVKIFGSKKLMVMGFCFLFLSIFVQFFMHPSSPLIIAMSGCFFFGIGWLFAWGPANTAAVASLPHDVAAIASGANSTIQIVGANMILTITGTLFRDNAKPFMDGYQSSLWALLVFTIIGLVATLYMKRPIRT